MRTEIITTILKDLSKIEFAIRSENLDREISKHLGIAIIELYICLIQNCPKSLDISDEFKQNIIDIYFIIDSLSLETYSKCNMAKDFIIYQLKDLMKELSMNNNLTYLEN